MLMFNTGILVFFCGLSGMFISFWRQNILIFLILTEIMFLGILITFIVLSNIECNTDTQIIALIVLTLAAIETAVGLCILVHAKTFINQLSFSLFNTLTG